MCTIIVKISGDSDSGQRRTLKCESLVYEEFSFSNGHNDPVLSGLVEDAKAQFNGPVKKVDITAKYSWE